MSIVKVKKRTILKNKKVKVIIIVISILIILIGIGSILYINIHGLSNNLNIKINGDKTTIVEVGSEYQDQGVTASYDNKKLSDIKVTGKVDNNKIGIYEITYTVKYKGIEKKIKRKVKVIDTTKPTINLVSSDINLVVGSQYTEPGYSAKDNYDGDITSNVKVTNNIDTSKIGEYKVDYTVSDSSNNTITISRKVNVIAKPKTETKVAVLNYHFFYDPSIGEVCNEGICEDVKDFRAQLDYLKQNNYKTLTMKEFRDWMYGVTEIPEKSVLITIDDGAMGTGKHNGNKLIPILEEYQMHATLFLITSWWDIENYRSPYLDIESHSNDMHNESWCQGVYRGARMLCQSDEQIRADLQKSIDVIGSKLAYCFPFYAYDNRTVNLVKSLGFDLAFIGGNAKATRSSDKWRIPRYPIMASTSLQSFINIVS